MEIETNDWPRESFNARGRCRVERGSVRESALAGRRAAEMSFYAATLLANDIARR